MLKARVIPCLDVKDGRVVKGVNFVDLRDAGDPVEAAVAYDAAGADELCFLDITASHEARGTLLDVVRAHGGGLLHAAHGGRRRAQRGRHPGAAAAPAPTRSSIMSAAVHDRAFVRRAAEKFGAQCIVVAIDAKQVGARPLGGLHPRRPPPTGLDAVAYAQEVVGLGAGEILLTSMDRDGTKSGFDLALTRAVSDAVAVPVIASGGVGTLDHLVAGVRDGGATAVLAASIFHFGEYTIGQAKRAMAAAGLRDAARWFGAGGAGMSAFTLETLAALVASRRAAGAEASYTKSLLEKGPARVAKKFGEEAVELVIAAVEGAGAPVTAEAADVLYHLLVLLESANVPLAAVLAELERRTAQSGHAEKAARSPAA